MSTKELLEKTADRMRRWQKVENKAVSQTSHILEETDHPLLRMVMEIIHNDSQMHHRVQQLVIDSLERTKINIPVEEMKNIWTSIEDHIKLEKKTIELAKESLAGLKDVKYPIQTYLLEYLQKDEEKHEWMLDGLNRIKKDMYPYSG